MSEDLPRRAAAEALGIALLVFFGAGSAVAATKVGGDKLSYPALGMVALAFGLAIAVAIYAFGSTSGAHINPAVTVSLALVGRFPWREVVPYVLAQLAGATAGALLIVAAFGSGAVDLGATGGTTLGDGVTSAQAIVAEALGTLLLVTAIMALAVDKRAPTGWAGFIIGLSVTAAILVVGPLTGGSFNPARTLGPLLTTALFGGDADWGHYIVYVVGPLAGGAVAAFGYDLIARPGDAEEGPDTDESEGTAGRQGTEGEVTGRAAGDASGGSRQGSGGTVTGERD